SRAQRGQTGGTSEPPETDASTTKDTGNDPTAVETATQHGSCDFARRLLLLDDQVPVGRPRPRIAGKENADLVNPAGQPQQVARQGGWRSIRVGRNSWVAEEEAREGMLGLIHAHDLTTNQTGSQDRFARA